MGRRRLPLTDLTAVVDRLVEQRYLRAVDAVAALRSAEPTASPGRLADLLIAKASRELAAVAALSSGAAASPGVGTSISQATAGADMAWTVSRLGELVIAIGIANGHDATSLEERKAWVLTVLSMANGATNRMDGLAASLGRRGGVAVADRLSATELSGVSTRILAKASSRLFTEQAATRLGRLAPFGVGAGIGAVGNLLITRAVGRAAKDFFSDETDPSPSGGRREVIDVDSTERPARNGR